MSDGLMVYPGPVDWPDFEAPVANAPLQPSTAARSETPLTSARGESAGLVYGELTTGAVCLIAALLLALLGSGVLLGVAIATRLAEPVNACLA